MAKKLSVDSNITSLRMCEETSLDVLPAAALQVWYPFEPNSYGDFGAQVTTVARNPINPGRKRKKGVVTDVNAAGGFVTDLTQTNAQRALQGFMYADVREKLTTEPMNGTKIPITSVSATQYLAASGLAGFIAGDLIVASGFANGANNGLKNVSASSATTVTVTQTLVVEASPPLAAKFGRVGWQFLAGEVTITQAGGAFPVLTRTGGTKDLTTFGLVPGEWMFIGGDTAPMQFATAANNGFARVRSVTTTTITFDKTQNTMVTDAGTAKTIQLYFGRALKDETGTSVKRRTYQQERILGFNDDTDQTKQQAEYLRGTLANELTLNVPTADKVTAELKYMALRGETMDENITGANTLRSKAAFVAAPTTANPALVEADAFNTSSDISRIKLSTVSAVNSNPTSLFAFVQEMTLTLNNNVTGNKALGVTGSFEHSSGTFEVGGSMTAYFADVAAIAAVTGNSDITIDAHFVKANAGVTVDLPLLALGDGRPKVEQDKAILLPLENSAAQATKVDPSLTHTLMFIFWDYLPSLADL